ncbi:MAG: hypothetical protein II998_08130 [Clostridia bacterium]|nr:hypothetical protein [Clostridia bacterium]
MDVDYPMFDVNSLPTSIEWTYTNGILTSVTDMIYENILFACISCVIVLFMEKYGIINHKVFKKRNMIIPFCIYALSYFGSPGIIFQFFGNTITYAYSNSSAMASITDISHIFYWMSMILYMMIKSGKLRMTMQKTLIFAGFSILYYIVTALIMQSYCVEIFGYDDEIAELIDIFMPLHFASNFMFCMYIFTIAILNGKNLMGCIGNIISVAVFITVHIFVSVFSIAFGHSAIKMVGAIRLLPFIITICSMIIIALINNRKNNEFIK